MAIPKILLISNLQTTSPLWAFATTQQHWTVILDVHPAQAVQRWAELLPDLIICDFDSESLGIEVVAKLRVEAVSPILLLTSNHSDKYVLEAYQAGADECIPKPVHPLVFEAKIKSWLRHTSHVPIDLLDAIKVGELRLVPSERSLVLYNKDPILLTNLEVRLLYILMRRPGRTLTTLELCQSVWGQRNDGDAATLKNLIYRLRHKIEADPAHPFFIHTVTGVGYQFAAS